MTLVVWNDKLSVGIKSVDEQHKKLITMLNNFYENIANMSNKANISKLITEMKKYTMEHFSYEEKLMDRYGFPGYISHKKEHESFILKVKDVEERYSSGKMVLSLEMTGFLFEWLKNHIQVTDKKYTVFLIAKGVN